MKMPMKALWTASRTALFVVAAIAVVACKGDVTTPDTGSSLAPRDANKALVGVVDGTYTVTIDPSQSYTLPLGASYMTLPANAICTIATSGYGASYWNSPCVPETKPVTITAVVTNAATDHPRVDLFPAMRFNPQTNVSLHIYVTDAATLDFMAVMKYCPTDTHNSCVDESAKDASLKTFVDHANKLVYRRIKHFSGYLIAE